MRFIRVLCLFVFLAGVFVGVAAALDFDDDSESVPRGEVGMIYDFTFGAHGGDPPYHYVIESGSLPPGLKLHADTGQIEGIPTEPGTFGAWIALKDNTKPTPKSAELLFTFEIWERRFAIATASVASATLGAAYSETLKSAGVAADRTVWTVQSGSLPPGLTLGGNGVISGTPTSAGAFSFTVTASASDPISQGTRVDTKTFTLTVTSRLTCTLSSGRAEVGRPFRAALTPAGGVAPYRATLTGLPRGLSFDGSQNVITGVPRRTGSFTLRATITDANGAAETLEFRLVVARKLAVVTTRLPSATVGRAYNVRIQTVGGVGPFRWTIGGGTLPAGLRLDMTTGGITGTPRRAGTSVVTLNVRDRLGAVSKRRLVLTVSA